MAIAVTGLLVKEAMARGGEPEALLTVRYVVAGLLLGVPLILAGSFPRSTRAKLLTFAIGLAMFTTGSLEFEALSRLPLSVVIVILFISPLWVALYSWVVRRERLGWQRLLAFAAALAGVVLLVGPRSGEYDLVGVVLALCSSLLWASILILIDSGSRVRDFSPPTAIGTAAAIAGAIALVMEPGALQAELDAPARVPYVLALGLTGALAMGLLAWGMRGHHIFDVALVSASEPLFAVLLGAAILDERLEPAQLAGILLIAAGVVTIIRSDRRHATAPAVV